MTTTPRLPTLPELVDKRPQLYDALRARDAAANRVCEVLHRGGKPKESLAAWRKAVETTHREFVAAVDEFNNASGGAVEVPESQWEPIASAPSGEWIMCRNMARNTFEASRTDPRAQWKDRDALYRDPVEWCRVPD